MSDATSFSFRFSISISSSITSKLLIVNFSTFPGFHPPVKCCAAFCDTLYPMIFNSTPEKSIDTLEQTMRCALETPAATSEDHSGKFQKTFIAENSMLADEADRKERNAAESFYVPCDC